jgi:succinylglutamate desuccinylase
MLALGKLLELTLAGREPTEKIQLTREGARLHWLGEGVLEVTPIAQNDSGLDLLLSAGIHGNETAPIELLDRLLQAIASGQLLPKTRILFLFGNPEAMRRGERYIEQDINRLFDGRHAQSSGFEALRANELERHAAVFFSREGRQRLHYDLHTAIRASKIEQFALYPYVEGRQHSRAELARLRAAGIDAVLLQRKTGITFSSYTYARLGAEAFTLELGKARVGIGAVRRVPRGDQAQRCLQAAPAGRYRELHRTAARLPAGRRHRRHPLAGGRAGRAHHFPQPQGQERPARRHPDRAGHGREPGLNTTHDNCGSEPAREAVQQQR